MDLETAKDNFEVIPIRDVLSQKEKKIENKNKNCEAPQS